MASVTDYIVATLLFELRYSQEPQILHARKFRDVAEHISTYWGSAPADFRLEPALEYLTAEGVISIISDPFSSDYYEWSEPRGGTLFDRLSAGENSPYQKARKLREPWLREVMQNIERLKPNEDVPDQNLSIPASDRVVTLSDNHPVSMQLRALAEELKVSNSIQVEMGEVAERVNAEIDAAVVLTSAKKVRITALIALLTKSLKFLAEKFAGSAVGTLAAELIKALMKLL